MAPRSRNSRTSVTKKRSSVFRNISSKQKKKKKSIRKKKRNSVLKRGLIVSFVLFFMVSLVVFGYYLGQDEKNISPVVNTKSTLFPKKAERHFQSSKIFSKVETKQPQKVQISLLIQKKQKHEKNESINKVVLTYRAKKPKLVIIIDDISNAKQLKRIISLGIPVTPSIFPPSELSMTSHELAKGLKHYMIHLPMESGNKKFNRQYKTLKTSFSKARMEARIKEIRRLFPEARYINNHTGSVFTSNEKAMGMLYGIMKKEGFIFIDSRTSSRTKVKKIVHAYKDAYVARDVFIDNKRTVPYILMQLKKAVKIAKKKGYAIAIGHPHKVTMQALASAEDIFGNVELVYIDQIYQKD